MILFTVCGFISEGGRFLDFYQDIVAESPLDAMEKILKQHANLFVSGVSRACTGRLSDY